jgi:hypothetical protein
MRFRTSTLAREQRSIIARITIFSCIVLTLMMAGSSRTKSQIGIYSALYVYSGCKAAANLAVSPGGTVPLYDPNVAFCWGAFTVLRGLTSLVSNDSRTMVLHVCAPSQSTVPQYIRIFLKYVDDHRERAHDDFDFVALEALVKAFPCQPPSSIR